MLAATEALPAVQNLPDGVRLVSTGDARWIAEIFGEFALAMAIGVLSIYAVLDMLFHKFIQPVTILAAPPPSAAGAVVALFVFDHALAINSLIAMIAGMTPIAMGWAGDPSFRAPMGVAVVGGLIVSTVMSLFIVPAMFTVVDDFAACPCARIRSSRSLDCQFPGKPATLVMRSFHARRASWRDHAHATTRRTCARLLDDDLDCVVGGANRLDCGGQAAGAPHSGRRRVRFGTLAAGRVDRCHDRDAEK